MEQRLKEINKEYFLKSSKPVPDEIIWEVSYLERQIERIIENETP